MLSVVILMGGVIVIVIGMWHAANRVDDLASISTANFTAWFPNPSDAWDKNHHPTT